MPTKTQSSGGKAAKPKAKSKTVAKPIKKVDLEGALYDIKGKEIAMLPLPKELFQAKKSENLLTHYVRVYLANQRQGNADSKTRSEVVGSTKKIYRQKGTGRARHGAATAPIFVGGGVAHGPKKRDHSLKMNKKQKRAALRSALTLRFDNHDIIFIKGLDTVAAKTKEIVAILKNLKLENRRSLLLYPEKKLTNTILACRNVKNITLKSINSVNAYDVLKTQKILFSYEALEVLKKTYENN